MPSITVGNVSVTTDSDWFLVDGNHKKLNLFFKHFLSTDLCDVAIVVTTIRAQELIWNSNPLPIQS